MRQDRGHQVRGPAIVQEEDSLPVASKLVVLFGWLAYRQFAVSSRSVWNSSLLIPISTLYASPENIRSDLFCAFHPKRAIVPSLPFLFVCPLTVRRRPRSSPGHVS